MAEIINPHDKFFKEMLAQPEAARIFLRDFLPPAVATQLDLSRLQLVKDSLISGDKGSGKDHRSKGRTRAC